MFKNRNFGWLIAVFVLAIVSCEASTIAEIQGPAKIRFGHTLAEDGRSIVDETNQFHLDDSLVYLVDLGTPFPTTGVQEMLSRMESKGEYVIHKESIEIPPGTSSMMNVELGSWVLNFLGPGHYKIRIMKDENILAEGDFELVK